MGAFVAGSHELSPSINYLLHNKIYSGQQQQQQQYNNNNNHQHHHNVSCSNHSGIAYGRSQDGDDDDRHRHLESIGSQRSSSATSSGSNKIDISRNNNHQTTTTTTTTTATTTTHHFHEVIPPMPPIKSLSNSTRMSPLTIEEYERNFREFSSDFELVDRVYQGGMASNKLRAAMWPYLFGLVKRRGRFKLATAGSDLDDRLSQQQHSLKNGRTFNGGPRDDNCYLYVEHEENVGRWKELERLYYSYQSQWKSIMPDQELRFSTFRERKSLIERDVIRSDRSHPFYADKSQNLTNLTTLLMTYMMYDFDIGYLQGMSDLAAPILYVFQGDLVKSFWVFVEMMKLFRRNFEYSQKTIHFQLNCLYRLIKMTDPKFAQFLKQNDCSNCFFAFRCIVCQFKRELMRNQNDYNKVLCLWDTIWCVQRRHELLAKTKFVHTFTIANGGYQRRRQSHHHNRQLLPSCRTAAATGQLKLDQLLNHHQNEPRRINGNHLLSHSYNGWPMSKHTTNGSPGSLSQFDPSPPAIMFMSNGPHQQQQQSPKTHRNQGRRSISGLSSQATQNRWNGPQVKPNVKQEQIVYTKETFYSSFDPNQADVPRFELTETEKFVLALCLSLIRRDRNQILSDRLDATEIHQHFIAPHLAQDLDSFIEEAYHIYHYLNTDCDLQLLVKGANGWSLSPGVDGLASTGSSLGDGSPKDAGDTADTADTYDLLRDYLIISPSSPHSSEISLAAAGPTTRTAAAANSNGGGATNNNRYGSPKAWDQFLSSPHSAAGSPHQQQFVDNYHH